MKGLLQLLTTLILIQAVGGLVNNLAGGSKSWWLVNHLTFLDGYEIYASIALGALGVALLLAVESRSRGKAKEDT
ncbi:hypothetical protein [Rhizohabitans arisaemae]|uniref:hypothetical protein n=1 Tax=Rhizohabitans arisaemae TaxID=2720610 RepID=UPI0024B170E8|nr:hypothetical protein [Rhizohabitans arisaemae]